MKVHRRRFLFTANYFFVAPERTPILFFYLWTFPPKIVDFVTQIAKLHYKVTRILKNPQIEYQNPQVKNLGSWKSVIRICRLFSTDSRQHSPTSAKRRRIQPTWNVCQLATLPFLHFIQSIGPILSLCKLLTVHPASKAFYCQRLLDNKVNHVAISPYPSLWLC